MTPRGRKKKTFLLGMFLRLRGSFRGRLPKCSPKTEAKPAVPKSRKASVVPPSWCRARSQARVETQKKNCSPGNLVNTEILVAVGCCWLLLLLLLFCCSVVQLFSCSVVQLFVVQLFSCSVVVGLGGQNWMID